MDDTHGAAWADFDNDGDPDLVELVGADRGNGSGPNHLFVNVEGKLEDQALALGVTDPLGRGRTPLWLDFDRDGRLDLAVMNASRKDGLGLSTLFHQMAQGGFEDASQQAAFEFTKTALFGQLSDLTGDNVPELLIHGAPYPQRIYDTTAMPFSDLTAKLGFPSTWNVKDVAIADYDGDLHPDLYLTVNRTDDASDFLQVNDFNVAARLAADADEQGLSFHSTGNLSFNLETSFPLSQIFIGSNCHHPLESSFILAPQDPGLEGMCTHVPGQEWGVFLGYDSDIQTWRVLFSSSKKLALGIRIDAEKPITKLVSIGFTAVPTQNVMLVYRSGKYVDRTEKWGLSFPSRCSSVVAGDFDNDMDVDLFMVCGLAPVVMEANILLENQGDGAFRIVPNAGGASGCRNCAMAGAFGLGPRVAIADYDGDGFLDIFVSNGGGNTLYKGSPPYLFRNIGNDNHWLEIDLEGVVSNRDGIGSIVWARAGGVTQMREQNGGMHLFAQNHPRLHFGLGKNTKVGKLVIHWPSGIWQELNDVPADQVIRLVEPSNNPESVVHESVLADPLLVHDHLTPHVAPE